MHRGFSEISLKIWSEPSILEVNILRCTTLWDALHKIFPIWGYFVFPNECNCENSSSNTTNDFQISFIRNFKLSLFFSGFSVSFVLKDSMQSVIQWLVVGSFSEGKCLCSVSNPQIWILLSSGLSLIFLQSWGARRLFPDLLRWFLLPVGYIYLN